MMVVYRSPELTDLHTKYWSFAQEEDILKDFCMNFMFKSDSNTLNKWLPWGGGGGGGGGWGGGAGGGGVCYKFNSLGTSLLDKATCLGLLVSNKKNF